MAIDKTFESAVAAYANAANRAAIAGPAAPAAQQPADPSAFAALVEDAGRSAVETMYRGEEIGVAAIKGEVRNLAEVVAAVNNAEITLQTVTAVRDRVVEAYKEIIRMPM